MVVRVVRFGCETAFRLCFPVFRRPPCRTGRWSEKVLGVQQAFERAGLFFRLRQDAVRAPFRRGGIEAAGEFGQVVGGDGGKQVVFHVVEQVNGGEVCPGLPFCSGVYAVRVAVVVHRPDGEEADQCVGRYHGGGVVK